VFLWDKAESVSLDLRDASLGAIEDDETSWPEKGNLFLDGLVYEHIAGGPTDAGTRLKWLDEHIQTATLPPISKGAACDWGRRWREESSV